MRNRTSVNSIRWCRWLVLTAAVSFLGILPTMAQSITLRLPQVQRGSSQESTLLFRPSDIVTIRWEESISGLELKIGSNPGHYTLKKIRMRGDRSSSFTPNIVGLPVGVYYAVLTDANAETFTEIQIEASADASLNYSREFKFAVESESTPRAMYPRGMISERVPTFEWEAIPGVVAYALVVSSSPFAITSTNGQISDVEGLNPVWIHLSSDTSALYGEAAEANPLIQFSASPLVPGHTYYYTILNAYAKTDPVFLSVVIGPVVSFTLEDRGALDKPVLTFPVSDEVVLGDDEVSFQWDAVSGTLSYEVSIFERLHESGGTSDLQVYSASTPNSSLLVPALEVFRRGEYVWFVIANDEIGAASVSGFATFQFTTEMGEFTFETRSADNDAELLGVTVQFSSTDGGYNPPNPLVNISSVTFSDSLVVGNYEFNASKDGFADLTVPVQIRSTTRARVQLNLMPLPSKVTGQVVDGSGVPVTDVSIDFTNILTDAQHRASSNIDGFFSRDLTAGTFRIVASKEGYRAAPAITISVLDDQILTLPTPLVVVDDQVSLSGRVTNQDGVPISQVRVRAGLGIEEHETITDGNGVWSLELSQGQWTLAVSKEGFLAPLDRILNLLAGDALTNINFVLVQQASRIEGRVQGLRTFPDGHQEIFPLSGAEVIAYPLAGSGTSTTTDDQGRFLLDLGTGSYSIFARKQGFDTNGQFELIMKPNQTFRDVSFQLNELNAIVFGAVIDALGNGVEGAEIRSSAGTSTISSVGGAFTLFVPDRGQDIQARRLGFIPSATLRLAPAAHSQVAGIILQLNDNAASVSGMIRTATGTLAGVELIAVSGLDRYETVSGPNGEYSLHLPGGEWTINAKSNKYRLPNSVPQTVRAGQNAVGVDFWMEPNFIRKEGFVASGPATISGAKIDYDDLDESLGRPLVVSTLTDQTGYYALILGARIRYGMRIEENGYETFLHTFTTSLPGIDIDFDVDLIPSEAVVSGVVQDFNGFNLADISVQAQIGSVPVFSTQTAADGSFQLNLEAGSYELIASASGFEPSGIDLSVTAGQRIDDLALVITSNTGAYVLTAVDPRGGVPVVDANLTITGPVERTGKTQGNGQLILNGVPPGEYQLVLSHSGFLDAVRTATIQPSTTLRHTIILIPSVGSVEGQVVSASGNAPLGGATIRLRGTGLDRLSTSDSNGRYHFGELPDGGYSIQAQKSGYSLSPAVAATLSFAERTITAPQIVLRAVSGRIVGSVVDGVTSTPLSQVVITASGSSGTSSTLTAGDGTFELNALEAGSWTVSAKLDEYRATPVGVDVLDAQLATLDIEMAPNRAAIAGRIRSATGTALPFDVSVQVLTSRETKQVFTAADGSFTIRNLPGGEQVVLKTLIQREGYLDVQLPFDLLAGASVLNIGDVSITLQSASLSGSAGIAEATIRVSEVSSGATIAIVSSRSTGSYDVPFLSPGSYSVEPSRLGYVFTPVSRTVSLTHSESGTASFSATASVVIVQILVVTRDGSAASNVFVRITSFDRTVDQTFITDENGLILPPVLPLGHVYRVEPIAGVYTFEPTFRELDLLAQTEVSISFTRVEVYLFISGSTKDASGESIDNVLVSARRSVNENYEASSVAGQFVIGPLPAGTYQVTGRKTGFIESSVSITLGENAEASGVELVLGRQSLEIRGKILRAGLAVEGQTVTLSGPASLSTQTSSDGVFRFLDVPVEEAGETYAEIAVPRDGRAALLRQVSYSLSDVGQVIELEDIILASGKITLELLDGINPIQGVLIALRGPEGRVLQAVSDVQGRFESSADLDAGQYIIDLIESDRLHPDESTRTIALTDAQTQVSTQLVLPFVHAPNSIFRSDQVTQIRVDFEEGANQGLESGWLLFRFSGDLGFTALPLLFEGDRFRAQLPAPGEQPFSYQTQITDGAGSVAYESDMFDVIPVVAGRLQSIILSPDPHESIIRVGETYSIIIQIRDGLGQDLTSDLISSGEITWTGSSSAVELVPGLISERLGANLVVSSPGDYSFTVSIRLRGETHERTSIFKAVDSAITDLQISAPDVRMRNDNGLLRLTVSGQGSDGIPILLGNSVAWVVSPSDVATIDNTGSIRTDDEQYIGELYAIARDATTGRSDTAQVAIFAELDGSRSRFLTDYEGTIIFLDERSIPFRGELALSYPRQPLPKRFNPGISEGNDLTAGEYAVRFSLKSERSLVGDSLETTATIQLPADASLKLYEGGHSVAYFDDTDLSWRVLLSSSSDFGVSTDNASKLGDYTVVSANQNLQIRHLSALPSPFSPEIAPLKIGYFLDTSSPPARVRIDIVNMRGELVRTLLSGDQQWPGRYGSRSSLRQIEWDGLTEDGKKARNGRYIIRIEARDRSGTVVKTLPVVLVK